MDVVDAFPSNGGVAAFSRVLATVPTPSSVLKQLATNHLHKWQVRAAWLAELEDSGTFRLEASFGSLDVQAFEALQPTAWGANSMAKAIESGAGVVLALSNEPLDDARFLDADAAVIAVTPIQPGVDAQFVLGLGFSTSQATAKACLAELYPYTPLLALYLTYLRGRRDTARMGGRQSDNDFALTARQMTILRLMDEGMKNRAISVAIGYSESTVRLEAMEIYRKLGVHGRREAVRVAAQLGMFDQAAEG